MTPPHLVIFHPDARQLRGTGLPRRVQALKAHLGTSLVFRRGDAPDLADRIKSVDPVREAILVIGGDGTLHHAINHVASALGELAEWPRIGFLPAGTANDAAKSIAALRGRPHDLVSVAAQIEADAEARGDIGCVDCSTTGLRRYFVGFAGLGAACDWVRIAEARWFAPIKRLGPGIAYPLCSLAVILRARTTELRSAIDGGELAPRRLFGLFAAKGRYLGGGLDVGEDARLDSGRLAVVEIPAQNRISLVRRLRSARAGGPARWPMARRLRLELRGPATLNVDGELLHLDAPGPLDVHIRVVPRRIRWI